VRNVPLFVVVSAPILGRALTDLAPRLPGIRARSAAPAIFSAVAVGLALRILTGAYYLLPGGTVQFRTGVGLDRSARPVAACDFLLANRLDGRILNSSNIGGWVGWALPQPAYLDMRLEVTGEDLYREEVESWRPGGLEPLLAKYRPQLIMADHGTGLGGWSAQLAARDDWRLVYADEVVSVHAHRDYAPHVPALALAGLPAAWGLGPPPEEEAAADLLRRPVPPAAWRWLEGFWRGPAASNPFPALGRFCASQGAAGAAERFFLESIRTAPLLDHGAAYDLGELYAATGRHRLALLAFDRYLALSPRDARAWNERGVAAASLGDPAVAIGDFSRSIDVDSGSAIPHLNRALARRATVDLAGAGDDYARALRIDPGNAQALRGLDELRRLHPGGSSVPSQKSR
jgi:tetratricopeptide (TPR) repeat protein